jgi:hypothetical protein
MHSRIVEDSYNLRQTGDLTIGFSHVPSSSSTIFDIDKSRSDQFIECCPASENPADILCNPLHLSRIEVIGIDRSRAF